MMLFRGRKQKGRESPQISSCVRPGTEFTSLLDAIPCVQIRLGAEVGGQGATNGRLLQIGSFRRTIIAWFSERNGASRRCFPVFVTTITGGWCSVSHVASFNRWPKGQAFSAPGLSTTG